MPKQPPFLAAGIDVGGQRKGFHGVALRDGIYLDRLHTREVGEVVAWCHRIQARVIGIDAPCRWSTDGRARPAERQLMGSGIWCFASPTHERALSHPSNYYGWMRSGQALFQALEPTHPLCLALPLAPASRCCFETFPQAIACALAGRIVSAKHKRTQRKALLEQAGIHLPPPTGIDTIDAALCALTAHHLASGQPCTAFGEPTTGLIITPDLSATTGF
ncbi:DUF429 domain-containing protein [Desulfobulbus propionicus]